MARIESQAKAGYYPTPESVCELLKTKITRQVGARLLDPCCGTGAAIADLAPATTTTYGIELNHERATEARTKVHQVLWGERLAAGDQVNLPDLRAAVPSHRIITPSALRGTEYNKCSLISDPIKTVIDKRTFSRNS